MQQIYPMLKQAEILVLATPVYIPLPGEMQNFINRLTPLLNPSIEYREGRTRAQFREDVQIRKIVLVATGGWWEPENFDTVIRIVKELIAVSGLEYSGSIIRPHVQYMQSQGRISEQGQKILREVKQAAKELINFGNIKVETLNSIQRPLISREQFLRNWS
jgi:multimeric flavodoxin WrbA